MDCGPNKFFKRYYNRDDDRPRLTFDIENRNQDVVDTFPATMNGKFVALIGLGDDYTDIDCMIKTYNTAQWVKRWLADLAVPGSRPT